MFSLNTISADEINQEITITYPTSDVTFRQLQVYTLQWSSENISDFVKIDLYHQGIFYSTIIDNTTNDGRYDWSISSTLPSNKDYQIRISSISTPQFHNESGFFNIGFPSITVISPRNSDEWLRNKNYDIEWSYYDAGSYVVIDLYYDNVIYDTISPSTLNDGEYNWIIPSNIEPNSNYRIRITAPEADYIYDDSGSFEILQNEFIMVEYPGSNKICEPGDVETLIWKSSIGGSFVKIDLYRNDEFYSTINQSTFNDGSYDWKVPSSIDPGSKYQIKITSLTYGDVYGISENYFTIEGSFWQKWSLPILVIAVVLIIIAYYSRSFLKNKDLSKPLKKKKGVEKEPKKAASKRKNKKSKNKED